MPGRVRMPFRPFFLRPDWVLDMACGTARVFSGFTEPGGQELVGVDQSDPDVGAE
jgi:ubiquinone/menaquinone biosynthesis C-methylase UbiE